MKPSFMAVFLWLIFKLNRANELNAVKNLAKDKTYVK